MKLKSENPTVDNLTIQSLSKAKALAKGNLEKFNDIQEGMIDQKNLGLNDILD